MSAPGPHFPLRVICTFVVVATITDVLADLVRQSRHLRVSQTVDTTDGPSVYGSSNPHRARGSATHLLHVALVLLLKLSKLASVQLGDLGALGAGGDPVAEEVVLALLLE